jgi:hypothetical protein
MSEQLIENKYFSRKSFRCNILQSIAPRRLKKTGDFGAKYPPGGRGVYPAVCYSVFFLFRALILNQIGLPMKPKFSRI